VRPAGQDGAIVIRKWRFLMHTQGKPCSGNFHFYMGFYAGFMKNRQEKPVKTGKKR
jgi:hypothetical protein